jgi:DNA-directed RNA polymerase subunit RPC12/RpoP
MICRPLFCTTHAPTIVCTLCRHSFQMPHEAVDEMSEGDEVECSECGRRLVCDEKNVTVEWCWSVVGASER